VCAVSRPCSLSVAHLFGVGGERQHPLVFHGSADGEVVDVLKDVLARRQAEHRVDLVVEKATDASAGEADRACAEIERLADRAGLPMQPAIAEAAVFLKCPVEI